MNEWSERDGAKKSNSAVRFYFSIHEPKMNISFAWYQQILKSIEFLNVNDDYDFYHYHWNPSKNFYSYM